jgi:hypothetical protein
MEHGNNRSMLPAEKHHAPPPPNAIEHDQGPLDFSTFVDGFVVDIKGYVNAQRHFMMLQASHKLAVLLAKAVQRMAVLSGFAFAALFSSVSLALYLGELLSSFPLGFLITAALALLLSGMFHLWWSNGGRERFILARINDMNDAEEDV